MSLSATTKGALIGTAFGAVAASAIGVIAWLSGNPGRYDWFWGIGELILFLFIGDNYSTRQAIVAAIAVYTVLSGISGARIGLGFKRLV
jgi:hypothetical protein